LKDLLQIEIFPWKEKQMAVLEEEESITKKATVAPLLAVRRGSRAIEFYKKAFGALEEFRTVSETGAVVARLSIEECKFWIADEAPENLNFSPASLGGSTVRMVLVVDDPDGVYERAVGAGAKGLWPVVDQPYGWRIGRLVDPFGHHWEIGKPIYPRN
jgi:PhnB protein